MVVAHVVAAVVIALGPRTDIRAPGTSTCSIDSTAVDDFLSRYRSALPRRLALERGALVVVCGGHVSFARGFGRTAAGDSVDPTRTIFRAASNSKLFAATAVMQLVDRGLWKLDDDVNRYLPPRARLASLETGGPVTLAHLLTHTAGFEDRFAGGVVIPADRLTLAEYFARNAPRRVMPAGAEISYSNIGMALAGYLVEVRSGEPFSRYAARNLFAPLGMTHSTFEQPPPGAWHRDLAGGPPRGRYDVIFNPYPAASLVTTPVDMGRFIAAHLAADSVDVSLGARRVLSPAATALMHAPHWRAQPDAPGAAYGFFEGMLNGRRTLFHTGDSGDHSLILLLPDEHVGLYFVFSGSDEQTDARDLFARDFMNTFFPDVSPSRAGGTGSREGPPISTLAGVYRSAAYSRSNYEKVRALFAQVTVRTGPRGTLLITPPGSSTSLELARTGALTFRRDSGEVVAFRTAPDGRVIGFTLSGLIWDPSSWDRIPWWENGRLHLAALGVAVLILFVRLAWTPVAWVARHARGRLAGRLEPSMRRAWRWSGLVAVGFFVAPLTGAASALLSFAHPLRAIPRGVAVATTLLLIDVVAGVSLGLVSVGAMRQSPAPRAKLVMIAFTAVACATLAIVLAHWNLLAPWSNP